MEKLSLIVPCYNEEQSLPKFYEEVNRLSKEMDNIEFELLFINDGSKDGTLNILRDLSKQDKRVRYISFSRNFFKEAGIYAGLKNCTGDYAAVMDADLQDPPSLLPEMLGYIKNEGYDSVATRRVTRKGEGKLRSLGAKAFYRIINRISDTEIVTGARDYRLMTRQMVNAVLEVSEYNRFSKGIFGWVGFKTKWLDYKNVERVAGTSNIKFSKLIVYAIEGIVSFSTAPLIFSAILGMLFCLIAFIMIIVIVIKTVAFGDPTSGWPSLACIVFLVSGVQLFSIGIIGEYLAKTYLETKKRPIYIVKETEKDIK
ncbi:MAG: glycosyltransferase family 2 protein [bacterium]|nr:glycosyltransferase family 2 protein [bacterium]